MKKMSFNKFALVLCFMLLNVGIASSQIRFGVKGGFDVSNSRVNKDMLNSSNRLGYQIGGTMEIQPPLIGWAAELSLLYGHQDFKTKNLKGKGNEDKRYDLSNYNYLRMPLNLKKKFDLLGVVGVFVAAGPYAEVKLSGGEFKDKTGAEEPRNYKSKSVGMGFNAGAGVEVLKRVEVGMYYRKSLTNDYSSSKPSVGDYLWKKKPSDWSINMTYFF